MFLFIIHGYYYKSQQSLSSVSDKPSNYEAVTLLKRETTQLREKELYFLNSY